MIIPARYTEVLDNLLRNEDAKKAIDEAMSDYPLYQTDPDKVNLYGTAYAIPSRKELNEKILNHYRFREIGQETFGRWLFELKTALNEIMPKYNQLFYSADQDFNPIYNVDYQKTITGTDSSTSNNSSTSNSSSSNTDYGKGVNARTPQDQLHISDTGIDTVDYADEASWSKNSGNATGNTTTSENNTTSGKNNTIETTKGNFGVVSAPDLIIKYRQTIINIEQEIINDDRIKELFMLIF